MSKKRNIAIAGSGPAGAAAALFLTQQGHDVTVFERLPNPQPIGAGFMLQPTGMYMLKKLGLLDVVAERATPINRLYGVNEHNKIVLDLKFDALKTYKHSLGIHRGLIFKVLHNALSQANISIRTGQQIDSFRRTADAIIPINEKGEEQGAFDLLVIADGSRSALREKVNISFKKHWYPWLAMWYVAKDTDFTIGNKIYHKYEKTRKLLGFMPIGFGPDESNTERLVNLFYSVPEKRLDEIQAMRLEQWKAEVHHLDPIADPYLDQISSMEDFTYTGYGRMKPSRMWDDRIAIIGDAAHGMSPQLGQGISMALLDAHSLSEHLTQFDSIEKGLIGFSNDRMNHLKYYLWADKMAAPLFQSHQPYQAYLRDWGLNALQKIPFTNRILLETMIGIKNGVFSNKYDVGGEVY